MLIYLLVCQGGFSKINDLDILFPKYVKNRVFKGFCHMPETKSACVLGRNLSFHETNKYSFSVNVQETERREKLPHLSGGNRIFQVCVPSDFALLVALLRPRLCSLMKVKAWMSTPGRRSPTCGCPASPSLIPSIYLQHPGFPPPALLASSLSHQCSHFKDTPPHTHTHSS